VIYNSFVSSNPNDIDVGHHGDDLCGCVPLHGGGLQPVSEVLYQPGGGAGAALWQHAEGGWVVWLSCDHHVARCNCTSALFCLCLWSVSSITWTMDWGQEVALVSKTLLLVYSLQGNVYTFLSFFCDFYFHSVQYMWMRMWCVLACPCLLPCSWCDSVCHWGWPGRSEADFWHDILLLCHCHPVGYHRRWQLMCVTGGGVCDMTLWCVSMAQNGVRFVQEYRLPVWVTEAHLGVCSSKTSRIPCLCTDY